MVVGRKILEINEYTPAAPPAQSLPISFYFITRIHPLRAVSLAPHLSADSGTNRERQKPPRLRVAVVIASPAPAPTPAGVLAPTAALPSYPALPRHLQAFIGLFRARWREKWSS